MKKYLNIAVFFVILAAIIYYVVLNWSQFQDIKNLSLQYIVILLFFTFCYMFSQGLILKAIMEPFNVRLKFHECLGIIMVTLMGNYFIPLGGVGFRAQYLKRMHNFNYTDFMSTFATIYIIEFLIFTIGGFAGLGHVYMRSGSFDVPLVLLFTAVTVSCMMTFVIPPGLIRGKNKIIQTVRNVLDSWQGIRTNRPLLMKLSYLTLLEFLLASAMFYFAFHSYSFDISYISSFLPSSLSDYSFAIRLTPGSIGVYEGSIVYASKLLGFSIAQGLLIVTVKRAVTIFWVFTLGPLFSYILLKQSPKVI